MARPTVRRSRRDFLRKRHERFQILHDRFSRFVSDVERGGCAQVLVDEVSERLTRLRDLVLARHVVRTMHDLQANFGRGDGFDRLADDSRDRALVLYRSILVGGRTRPSYHNTIILP